MVVDVPVDAGQIFGTLDVGGIIIEGACLISIIGEQVLTNEVQGVG